MRWPQKQGWPKNFWKQTWEKTHTPIQCDSRSLTGDKTLEMSGASVGGGMIQITRLQGRSVQIRAELDTLILIADDRPGTINAVSGWLAAHQINIAFLRLKRDQRGGKAMMVIETDQNIPEALTRDLASLPWVHWVYQIPRLKE